MLKDEPSIVAGLYILPRDPLVDGVLIPAFGASTRVRGAFGWFSSGWLSTLSHGLARFLSASGTTSLQLIIAPALFPEDYDFLERHVRGDELVMERIASVIDEGSSPSAHALQLHAIECLGWMLQHNILDLRIAIPRAESNFHPKIWHFDDGSDQVLVRGSANATGRALGEAMEHMDVDCSWENPRRVKQGLEAIEEWMRAGSREIHRVVPISVALREKLIKLAPAQRPTVEDYQNATLGGGHVRTRSRTMGPCIPPGIEWQTGRFAHQGRAVDAWEQANRLGILEMATGAGKTKTALIAATRFVKEFPRGTILIITAPTRVLIKQWEAECKLFGFECLVPGSLHTEARKRRFSTAYHSTRSQTDPRIWAVICSNEFFKSQDLCNWLSDLDGVQILHVGDEAHSLGAKGCLPALRRMKQLAGARLGLSATPEREFDENGTKEVWEYFGGKAFEFSLEDAIGVCLVPYHYYFRVAWLDDQEIAEFDELSRKLGELSWAAEDEDASGDRFRMLLIERKRLTECAHDKLRALGELLSESILERAATLFYASAKQPRQAREIEELLGRRNWRIRSVTSDDALTPAELSEILGDLARGEIDGIVAKKMLDEGVDVPAVRQAVLVASSKGEREWIQRRGRVLRMHPGKQSATIVDIVALPRPSDARLSAALKRYVEDELGRTIKFAKHALNRDFVVDGLIAQMKEYRNG